MAELSVEARERHWAKTRNLTIVVLVLWVVFAIIIPAMAGLRGDNQGETQRQSG